MHYISGWLAAVLACRLLQSPLILSLTYYQQPLIMVLAIVNRVTMCFVHCSKIFIAKHPYS